jgi:acyl-CoA thioester hydrolase
MTRRIPTRAEFRHFLAIPTRWMDNDNYGHVNNVVYYAYFDTLVNEHLIHVAGLDFRAAAAVGIVVETCCRFHRSLSFPGVVDAGMRVARIGNTSVRYEIGLFAEGEDAAAADGHFVHVWVERTSNRPTGIPQAIRNALTPLLSGAAA